MYEKDGATIKDLEGSLCYNPRGVSTDSEENKKKDENYFDSCEAQGYMQTSGDCYHDESASGVERKICPHPGILHRQSEKDPR